MMRECIGFYEAGESASVYSYFRLIFHSLAVVFLRHIFFHVFRDKITNHSFME